MRQITAAKVVVAQLGEVDDEPLHMNSVTGRDVVMAAEDAAFTLRGSGLSESYPLADVASVEVTPDGSRFGLMAPGEVTGLHLPQPGMHMVRVGGGRIQRPRRPDPLAFGWAVAEAVQEARKTGPDREM